MIPVRGQTKLADTLQTLFGVSKRKGLLVVMSDFLECSRFIEGLPGFRGS